MNEQDPFARAEAQIDGERKSNKFLGRPSYIPALPEDPSNFPIEGVRKLFFQFTELFRWARQAVGMKKAKLRMLRARVDNEANLRQVSGTQVRLAERKVRAQYPEVMAEMARLEASIAIYEALSEGFQAAREALSREITIRTTR